MPMYKGLERWGTLSEVPHTFPTSGYQRDGIVLGGAEGQFSDPSLQGNFDQQNHPSDPLDHSLLYILLMGFVGGLLVI
jgi:hypothetical protein